MAAEVKAAAKKVAPAVASHQREETEHHAVNHRQEENQQVAAAADQGTEENRPGVEKAAATDQPKAWCWSSFPEIPIQNLRCARYTAA